MTTAGIKDRLASLGIDNAEPVIVGSGILDVVGIRPSNDIDLLVSKETFYKIATLAMKYHKDQMAQKK